VTPASGLHGGVGADLHQDVGLGVGGKEMAQHRQIADATGTSVYFCDAHSPWQRGSNENMNGLLRQHFPKGSDLRCHSPDDLADVAAEIDCRPRRP